MWPFKSRAPLPLLRLKMHFPDRLFLLKCTTYRICDACGYSEWNMNASSAEPKVETHCGCPGATVAQQLRATQISFESRLSYSLWLR